MGEKRRKRTTKRGDGDDAATGEGRDLARTEGDGIRGFIYIIIILFFLK